MSCCHWSPPQIKVSLKLLVNDHAEGEGAPSEGRSRNSQASALEERFTMRTASRIASSAPSSLAAWLRMLLRAHIWNLHQSLARHMHSPARVLGKKRS